MTEGLWLLSVLNSNCPCWGGGTGRGLCSDLLLERYWPIFSWLFHNRRWSARTLPSLMKDRLWFTESLAGQSEAMSKKNLQRDTICNMQVGSINVCFFQFNFTLTGLWPPLKAKKKALMHLWRYKDLVSSVWINQGSIPKKQLQLKR